MADNKYKVANAFADMGMPDDSLADGIGQGFPLMSYKGKVWRLRRGGQTFTFEREDGSTIDYIDVVIVGQSTNISKSYYPDGFVDGAGVRPTCASADGEVPDPNVESPQSPTCHTCVHNRFKLSGPRKGKDCSDYKRMAVLLDSQVTTKLLGAPLQEPVFLRVPAASLTALSRYGVELERMDLPYYSMVTRIRFVPDKPHPQFTFDIHRMLKDEEAPAVKAMVKDELTARIIGKDIGAPQIAAQPKPKTVSAPRMIVEPPPPPKPKRKPIELVQTAPEEPETAEETETMDDTSEPVTKSSSQLDSRIADLLK